MGGIRRQEERGGRECVHRWIEEQAPAGALTKRENNRSRRQKRRREQHLQSSQASARPGVCFRRVKRRKSCEARERRVTRRPCETLREAQFGRWIFGTAAGHSRHRLAAHAARHSRGRHCQRADGGRKAPLTRRTARRPEIRSFSRRRVAMPPAVYLKFRPIDIFIIFSSRPML